MLIRNDSLPPLFFFFLLPLLLPPILSDHHTFFALPIAAFSTVMAKQKTTVEELLSRAESNRL